MQPISVFFLIVFSAFLMTPSLVTVLKNNADISYIFNAVEEEQNNSERKLLESQTKILNNFFSITFLLPELISSNPINTYYMDWANINTDTFSPPPEHA